MKNMKKLVALIAVFAMMLSMASVAFAAYDPTTEFFEVKIDTVEVLEGTTDTIDVKIQFTVVSETNAVNGVTQADFMVMFDQTKVACGRNDWEISPDLNPTKMLFGSTVNNNGTNGVLKIGYQSVTLGEQITSESYFLLHFRLLDGVEAGTTIPITAVSNTANAAFNAVPKMATWMTKQQVTDSIVNGAIKVVSGEPDPIVVTPGLEEPNFGNADPKENSITTWGTLSDTELPDGFEYGIVVFDGEGDFDATTEGAVTYSALGNKEGLFAIRLLGDLVKESFRIKLYTFDGTDYSYFAD